MTRYEEILQFVVGEIVDDRDAVEIHEESRDRGITLRVAVAPEDMGKVIGKGGHTIDALRTVVRAAGVRNHERIYVDLEEPDKTWADHDSKHEDEGEEWLDSDGEQNS